MRRLNAAALCALIRTPDRARMTPLQLQRRRK
jgi:hypothetical protein